MYVYSCFRNGVCSFLYETLSESFRHLPNTLVELLYHIVFHTVMYSSLDCLFSLLDSDIDEGSRLITLLEFVCSTSGMIPHIYLVVVQSLSGVRLLRTHGLQPTRLLHPWDFPGKSIGVGCHCLLRS